MKASVVIRCRDEERRIGRVLEGVRRQETDFPFEVIVIDSGSTDGTPDIVSDSGCRLIRIRPEEFGYGRTMNMGAREAGGEILVYLSAHCPPAGKDWLSKLTAPFSDPAVAGAFGGQVPEPGVNPFEEWRLARAFPKSRETLQENMFSSANGAVRKSVWEVMPFDEALPFSEDRKWAKGAEAKGYKIVYVPDAAVYHSHPFSLDGVYKRAYAAGWAKKSIYGRSCRFDSIAWAAGAYAYCLAKDALHLTGGGHLSLLKYAPRYRGLELSGFYAGARDFARGASHKAP